MKNRQHSRKVLSTVAVLLVMILSLSMVTAQDDQSDIDVTVEIDEDTIIDIQPAEFAWGTGAGIIPGNVAGPDEEQNSYASIMVENLGSVDIEEVWFETTKPDERPFGTGDASFYDPANFLTLEDGGDFQFIERREYALGDEDEEIVFLSTPDDTWDVGRFRNTSREYFWTLEGTAENDRIRIGVDHRDDTQTGSTNLADECEGGEVDGTNVECNEYTLSADGSTEILVGDLDVTGAEGERYCAIVQEQDFNGDGDLQTAVDFVKWNPTRVGASSGGCDTVTDYVVDSGNPLVPGDFINVGIRTYVPFGVVSGALPDGQLTVFANSAQ